MALFRLERWSPRARFSRPFLFSTPHPGRFSAAGLARTLHAPHRRSQPVSCPADVDFEMKVLNSLATDILARRPAAFGCTRLRACPLAFRAAAPRAAGAPRLNVQRNATRDNSVDDGTLVDPKAGHGPLSSFASPASGLYYVEHSASIRHPTLPWHRCGRLLHQRKCVLQYRRDWGPPADTAQSWREGANVPGGPVGETSALLGVCFHA